MSDNTPEQDMEKISTPPTTKCCTNILDWPGLSYVFFSEILEKNTDFMTSPKAFDEKHIFWKNLKNHAPDLLSRSP